MTKRSSGTRPKEHRDGGPAIRRKHSLVERGLVSVVIPVFNETRYLAEAIDSVQRQRYRHHEIIVVDDGSTRSPVPVTRRYRGIALAKGDNVGTALARERGFTASRGEFVAFLDADDRLLPNAFATGVRILREDPELAFVSGRYVLIDQQGRLLEVPDRPLVTQDHYLELLRGNYVGMIATALFRRDALLELPGLDPGVHSCEDYAMMLDLARTHRVAAHDEIVAEYRLHGANKSADARRMLRASLFVLDREQVHARGNQARTAALNQGRNYYRQYYGNQVVGTLREQERSGEWRAVASGLVTLWRYHPSGFRHHVKTKSAGLLRRIASRVRQTVTMEH